MYAITPKERLQQYAKHRFGSYKEMELHCGLVNGAVGTSTEVSMKNLVKVLESCPELSPDWLILGQGPMERIPERFKPVSNTYTTDRDSEIEMPSTEQVAEPTQPYKAAEKDKTITIPSSVLKALQQQLENKDAQIATILQIMNAQK